ncbi:aminotransferase class IV [Mangrovibacterium sp.]|uniref:aminotransferase class IV n=1 Tax=Mangrovibacterium sp. TaxID=1961364 RepID=UPI003569CB5C
MIGFSNGVYHSVSEISIPITSISINRGYGAFEFFGIVKGRAFYGDRHLNRLRRSMQILRLKTNYDEQLEEIVEAVITKNQLSDAYLKLFVLPHDTAATDHRQASLYVYPTQMPLFDSLLYEEGGRLVTKNFQRFLPEAKSTNYLAGQYWMDEQNDSRVVDVLYHNGHSVQETSRGNVFIVKDGTVITPAENVLNGVTRGLILECLSKNGILHAEAEVSLALLYSADEVFLSSTTKHILPITQIDGRNIGSGKPGRLTREMIRVFQQLKDSY